MCEFSSGSASFCQCLSYSSIKSNLVLILFKFPDLNLALDPLLLLIEFCLRSYCLFAAVFPSLILTIVLHFVSCLMFKCVSSSFSDLQIFGLRF